MRKLALLILLIVPAIVPAQTSSFVQYSVEEGMIQSQVQSLVQDQHGNLWIGTLAGLSRYNGQSFQNYTRKDGLAEDWVTVHTKIPKTTFGFIGRRCKRYNQQSKNSSR